MLRTGACSICARVMTVTILDVWLSGVSRCEAVTVTSSSVSSRRLSVGKASGEAAGCAAVCVAWAKVSMQPATTPMLTTRCILLKALYALRANRRKRKVHALFRCLFLFIIKVIK